MDLDVFEVQNYAIPRTIANYLLSYSQKTCSVLFSRKFTIVTDHEPLKHFHKTKKPDLRFKCLKADLCGYEFDIIYRPGPRNSNADALSRNPIIREGEVDPELPRVQLYELATKQEEYDNYNEHDPLSKVLHLTKATKETGSKRRTIRPRRPEGRWPALKIRKTLERGKSRTLSHR